MNEEFEKNAMDACQQAEQKAAQYFQLLQNLVKEKTYATALIKDIQSWKHGHIHPLSFLAYFLGGKRKTSPGEYHKYLLWLDSKGKLDHYLDRSISYIFMRDLGKTLHATETQTRIRQVVTRVKTYLIRSAESGQDDFSMAGLYRYAQKEGIESALFWVAAKLKEVSANLPEGMDADQAQRKLMKLIAGVFMHELEEIDEGIPRIERSQKLDEAIRLGYSYGLTYPFIDDLLDADILSDKEKRQYSNLIRYALINRNVPEFRKWTGSHSGFIRFIHSELRAAFEYIKSHQAQETRDIFFGHAYVFFHFQEIDRAKDLSKANYTNEDLFIPVILKSAYSRLIARSVLSAPLEKDFENRTFLYGIYNQLADDFTDLFDDLKKGAVTPYTYYLKYHRQRPDLINPFELYWAVIYYLIHHVYHSDVKTREVILDRAINGQKRFRERWGAKKYNEVIGRFAPEIPQLNRMIKKMVMTADDVDFFDKLLRDHMIARLKNNRKEQNEFFDTVTAVREEINNHLKIPKDTGDPLLKEPIVDAANYSLADSGKRLRPIMAWAMGVHEYGLEGSTLIPLVRSLEYMHTASLIFDDLPAQDNAPIRRGRPTLHQVYNAATAELTGLFLTQKAYEEQASLDRFDPKTVLRLIKYSAQRTGDMCRGQAMDLSTKGKSLTLEQLNRMSFYKTGIGFEAALVLPAILAQATESEMDALKKFAYHAGIAYQIKDDLLDVEGDSGVLGKPVGIDAENNRSTFVSILGTDGARKAMWEHYCLAMEAWQGFPHKTTFLKHLLNYLVNRDH